MSRPPSYKLIQTNSRNHQPPSENDISYTHRRSVSLKQHPPVRRIRFGFISSYLKMSERPVV